MVPLLTAFLSRSLAAVPPQTWMACLLAFMGVGVMMGYDDPNDGPSALWYAVVRIGEGGLYLWCTGVTVSCYSPW